MPRLFPAAAAALVGAFALAAPASAHPHHDWWWPQDDGSATADPAPPDAAVPAPPDAPVPVPPDAPQPPAGAVPAPAPPAPELPGVPSIPVVAVPKTATIPGTRALVRADGKAAIPRGAPLRVRRVIAAANRIVGKPYKWGGGHARLADRGYDCSGAVSYSLVRSGLLGRTMVSGQLARWGAAGAGRWITVYATRSHVYLEVAGLRFDTSPVADPTGRRGVRWRPAIGRRPHFHVRHPVGL